MNNISLGSSVLTVSERFKKVVTEVLFNISQDHFFSEKQLPLKKWPQ
jgi:hypothetical protein